MLARRSTFFQKQELSSKTSRMQACIVQFCFQVVYLDVYSSSRICPTGALFMLVLLITLQVITFHLQYDPGRVLEVGRQSRTCVRAAPVSPTIVYIVQLWDIGKTQVHCSFGRCMFLLADPPQYVTDGSCRASLSTPRSHFDSLTSPLMTRISNTRL